MVSKHLGACPWDWECAAQQPAPGAGQRTATTSTDVKTDRKAVVKAVESVNGG